MNVTIVTQVFTERSKAVVWMQQQYARYPDASIVSSFMTKDNGWTACYLVIDQDKLNPTEKKLIKIT